jgi:hypothetical protein
MMVRVQGVLLELFALFLLKAKYFWLFVVFFCLLNSMTILQAKTFIDSNCNGFSFCIFSEVIIVGRLEIITCVGKANFRGSIPLQVLVFTTIVTNFLCTAYALQIRND